MSRTPVTLRQSNWVTEFFENTGMHMRADVCIHGNTDSCRSFCHSTISYNRSCPIYTHNNKSAFSSTLFVFLYGLLKKNWISNINDFTLKANTFSGVQSKVRWSEGISERGYHLSIIKYYYYLSIIKYS